jgi:hypothetical protein
VTNKTRFTSIEASDLKVGMTYASFPSPSWETAEAIWHTVRDGVAVVIVRNDDGGRYVIDAHDHVSIKGDN